MRKVLIIILLVSLFVLAYFTIAEGIEIGDLNIQSVKGIVELNNSLTAKISETNTKIDVNLQQKETELTDNINVLLDNKESYYKLANVSTESEINKASTEETYDIEYLWVRVKNWRCRRPSYKEFRLHSRRTIFCNNGLCICTRR